MIKSLSEFKQAKVQAEENPVGFWSEVAREFHWKSPWKQTLDYDFSIPEVKWFIGGKLNITENCLDRHLATQPNKTAILFEPNDPTGEVQRLTYKELHSRVCQTANMLKANGQKGRPHLYLYAHGSRVSHCCFGMCTNWGDSFGCLCGLFGNGSRCTHQ